MQFRHLRWIAIAAGLFVLLRGGLSVFAIPDDEVLYAAEPPITSCISDGCILIYKLEIGNTGRNPRAQVRVHLRAGAVEAAILPLAFRNFGKVKRQVSEERVGGTRVYDLGRLKPQERVELSLVLRVSDRSQAPQWNELLVAVDADTAEVRAGSPTATTFARWMYAIFGAWGVGLTPAARARSAGSPRPSARAPRRAEIRRPRAELAPDRRSTKGSLPCRR